MTSVSPARAFVLFVSVHALLQLACNRSSPRGRAADLAEAAAPMAPMAKVPEFADAAVTREPSSVAVRVVAKEPHDRATGTLTFAMAVNPEMVPYCLPYPSSYLREDFSERWEHGRKVFVRPTSGLDVSHKPSRMDLAGTCGASTLREIYERDLENIKARHSAATIALNVFRVSSYVLSWSEGDRIVYGKIWSAKNDPGCFVHATFDYDIRERAIFDTIIAHVASADPECQERH